jgi:hypothetical protein
VAGLAEENGRILLANSKVPKWVSNMPSFEKEKSWGKLAQEKILLEL